LGENELYREHQAMPAQEVHAGKHPLVPVQTPLVVGV
jgi:hypothetical protein